ncbi:MAG: aminotransferase class IV [Planctomycetaceae bacterium]
MSDIAWLNGQLLPFSKLRLPVWDLGVVAGAAITEMARTYAHQPFRIERHLDRLLSSCAEIGFDIPYAKDSLHDAVSSVVQENARRLDAHDDLGIVVFVTAGANRTYLGAGPLPGPTVAVHTFRLPLEIWRQSVREGVRLRIPQRRQIECNSLPVHLKIRNRLHWWLADREADQIEAGSRALLLDSTGCLTETSTACFYAVIDGTILTPAENVLNSLSCEMVQAAAEHLKIGFERTRLTPRMLTEATEAFVSSTPVGLLPVRSVDDVRFPLNGEHSMWARLLAYWKQQTGVHPAEQILGPSDSR